MSTIKVAVLVLVVGAAATQLVLAMKPVAERAGKAYAGTTYAIEVADLRTCSAAAVYHQTTQDDWSQRAAIARATLNRFQNLGNVPDCGDQVAATLHDGLDRYRWQAALDAVDAVLSGSYALPLACVRADTVLPLPAVPTEPPLLRAAAARAQCVIGDLAFVESPR